MPLSQSAPIPHTVPFWEQQLLTLSTNTNSIFTSPFLDAFKSLSNYPKKQAISNEKNLIFM